MKTKTIPAHGTRKRYLRGPDIDDQPGKSCRCDDCRAANTRGQNRYRLATGSGRRRLRVDAEPVRQHVRALQEAGLSYQRVAQLAGVDRQVIGRLLYGRPSSGEAPTKSMGAAGAKAILAVTVTQLPPHGWVPGIGTQRRLRALSAIGWSVSQLADRFNPGTTKHPLTTLMAAGPDRRVTVATARRVRDIYDELWNVDPVTAGAIPGLAQLVRDRAAAKGWVPPQAWDDDTIDDPAAQPDLGDQTTRAAALFEDSEELLGEGFTLAQAAERLGVAKNTLQAARDRAKRKAVAA
ncbi:hypothetical protein [Actinomadura sp. DC4]|uniref:hypothetical protein n=1 Tax=Actinomadura sp. DC4 TaxID=3055069 RepID=UPI0025AFAAC7|nr:hypothetical protein [Actinomadura sp. DC4]MDN3356040.1 hypothetical protein [Actinomadura sp. DC4]